MQILENNLLGTLLQKYDELIEMSSDISGGLMCAGSKNQGEVNVDEWGQRKSGYSRFELIPLSGSGACSTARNAEMLICSVINFCDDMYHLVVVLGTHLMGSIFKPAPF